jgi:hypothetical protein
MTPLAAGISLAVSLVVGGWSFSGVVRGYRHRSRVPWLASVVFAAAATGAVFALHALLAP